MKIKAWVTTLVFLAVSLVCFSYLYAADDGFLNVDNSDNEQTIAQDKSNRVTLGVWGGYSMVNMTDLNTYIDYENAKFYNDYSYDKPKNAYEVGLDLNYKVTPNLKIGPRIGYIIVSSKDVVRDSQEYYLDGDYYSSQYEETDKYNMTLLPILIGGEYFTKYNDKFSYNCKLYLGYGLASMKINYDSSFESNYSPDNNYSDSAWTTWKGSDFVGEASVGGDLALSPRVSLGMDLGYRFAKIKKMKLADSDIGDLGGNIVFEDEFGKAIPLDFSGITAAIRANFVF